MPIRIAHIIIAIAAHVVKIFAQQTAGNACNARVIQQRGKRYILIDKGDNARARRTIVRFAIMPAAMRLPERLEFTLDLSAAVGQQAGKAEVPKRVEKVELGIG